MPVFSIRGTFSIRRKGLAWGNSLGKLRWEGARPDAGRDEAVEIAWGNFAGRERDRMLDGMKPWK